MTEDRRTDSEPKPSSHEVRAQLERILRSRCFEQAGRASEFLRYVVEQTLAGEGARLKGYTIGVEVFGRPADFDAQSDALVRVEAGRLRRRLIEYYAGEGAGDAVRIELPRGAYVVDYAYAPPLDQSGEQPAAEQHAAALVTGAGGSRWRRVSIVLGALLVAAFALIAWQQRLLLEAGRAIDVLGERERTEFPRVVVVPFENLSQDPKLDALAASMTEEIMLVLDQLDLFVVATQTSWYGPISRSPLRRVAAGGYVLTGSLRETGDKARVTIRLIEAESGVQLWTAAYDEPLAFEGLPLLQERIAREVAAVAAPYGPLFEAELTRARRAQHTPELRDCLVMYYDYRRRIDPATHKDALLCLESVSARKPNIAQVWAGIAMLRLDEFGYHMARDPAQSWALAREATAKALAIDPDDFRASMALMRLKFFDGDLTFRDGIERVLALRPDSVEALAQAGVLLVLSGDVATGLPLVERAKALSGRLAGVSNFASAVVHLRDGRYEAALAAAKEIDAPNWIMTQIMLAVAGALSGDHEVARSAARRIIELYPQFESQARRQMELRHLDPIYKDRLLEGFTAAGLHIE